MLVACRIAKTRDRCVHTQAAKYVSGSGCVKMDIVIAALDRLHVVRVCSPVV